MNGTSAYRRDRRPADIHGHDRTIPPTGSVDHCRDITALSAVGDPDSGKAAYKTIEFVLAETPATMESIEFVLAGTPATAESIEFAFAGTPAIHKSYAFVHN